MRINHNIQALNAYRNLSKNQSTISKHMERLSSGLRINHASDDAAGLAISEKMRTQIRGLEQAERNTMDGISLVQTAEGALDSVQQMLQRMRELAVQAANDTATEADRLAIQDEINQLTSEINRVGNAIEFNSRKLLDGSISSSNFSGTGRLQGGAEQITGVEASGALVLKDATDNIIFDIKASANATGTELNGFRIVFGTDSDSLVSAALNGRTITLTADWDGSDGNAPTLQDIQDAINTVLQAENYGTISLTDNLATNAGYTFNPGNFAPDANGNYKEIVLTGGVNQVAAKKAQQIISVNSTPKENDILIIDGVKIGFWDSSKTTYADASFAKAQLGVDHVISIYDGVKYKTSSDIAYDIFSIGNEYPNVTIDVSAAGSDLIITANDPGVLGNNIRTDYLPTLEAGLNLQIGANTGQRLVVDIPNVRAQALKITGITPGGEVFSADGKTKAYLTTTKTVNNGLDAELVEYSIDVTSHEKAAAAITIFEDALNRVSSARSKLGAYQNRLEYTSSNLAQTAENVTAAESRIRDADMALEMTNFTKNNIINQAAQAMLAQANQLPQGILQLLK